MDLSRTLSPAAPAPGASFVLVRTCPDHHFPGITCASCDDAPGIDRDTLVPFPPVDPAPVWHGFRDAWATACDEVNAEGLRVLRSLARIRAEAQSAVMAAAMGNPEQAELHRQAYAGHFATLLSDLHSLQDRAADLPALLCDGSPVDLDQVKAGVKRTTCRRFGIPEEVRP